MKFKFFNRAVKVSKQFDKYKAIKKVDDLEKLAKNDSFLKKALKKITLKRFVIGAAATAGISYGSLAIEKYLNENTGCFLHTNKTSVCKVKELSCCNQKQSTEIPFCTNLNNLIFDVNTCNGFDENIEKSCCRKCDCNYFNCSPNQELHCKKATIPEALSYLTSQTTTGILNSIFDAVSSVTFVRIFIIAFVVIIITIIAFKFI